MPSGETNGIGKVVFIYIFIHIINFLLPHSGEWVVTLKLSLLDFILGCRKTVGASGLDKIIYIQLERSKMLRRPWFSTASFFNMLTVIINITYFVR